MKVPFVARSTGPFSGFVVLYVTAFLLEMVEGWRQPFFTAAFLVGTLLVLSRISRVRFLIFLAASTLYFLTFAFPDVANHVNLMIFANVALIAGIAYSFTRSSGITSDEAFFEAMQPVLRLIIIATFSVAGFHKLNRDFIDPAISCVSIFSREIRSNLAADFLGIGLPTYAAVLAVAVAAGVVLWHDRRHDFAWPRVDWPSIVSPLVAMATIAALLLAVIGWERIDSLWDAFVFVLAVFVLCWQLVEGPLLLFRRFQWVALGFSLLVHAQLAMIHIVDFQAVAIALLATFVPARIWDVILRSPVTLGPVALDRPQAYFAMNVLAGGAVTLAQSHLGLGLPRAYVVTGILYNSSVLILPWPVISELFSRNRDWTWDGVRVFHPGTPRLLYLAPALLVLFGLTSHVGLRTAGNFSMFSNLRTEGGISNHFIVSEPLLPLGRYQDDLVTIIEIDDARALAGYHYHDLRDRQLPMVEFRKLLYLWGKSGTPVPITLEYDGRRITSADIATEPGWRVTRPDWEMRLLDFRIVQREADPNLCRW